MRLLVCGGRDYQDRAAVYRILDGFLDEYGDDLVVIHGCCKTGADKFADDWCAQAEVDCIRVPARWKRHGGKSAGPLRNKRMRDRYKPHKVLAFPGGDGTQGMIGLAREAQIEVIPAPKTQ